MRRSNLLLTLCLVVVSLAGCGQKGPLTLPPAKPGAAATPAVPTSAAPAPAASSASDSGTH